MGDFGIKISKTGESVTSGTDDEMLFNSSYPSLKIHSSGTGSTTFTNNEGQVTLTTHSLGYKPFFAVWVDDGGGFELCTYGTSVGDYSTAFMGTATTSVLKLVAVATYVGGAWGDPTLPPNIEVDYKWVVFYDPITL